MVIRLGSLTVRLAYRTATHRGAQSECNQCDPNKFFHAPNITNLFRWHHLFGWMVKRKRSPVIAKTWTNFICLFTILAVVPHLRRHAVRLRAGARSNGACNEHSSKEYQNEFFHGNQVFLIEILFLLRPQNQFVTSFYIPFFHFSERRNVTGLFPTKERSYFFAKSCPMNYLSPLFLPSDLINNVEI